MYRSVSSTRVPDEYFKSSAPASSSSSSSKVLPVRALSLESTNNNNNNELSLSEVAKKEKARLKFAENAVHLIPFVLLLCAFILWFVSNPDVDLPMKGDSIAARIEGLTLEGDIDSDGTQRGTVLQDLDLGDHVRTTDHDEDRRRPIL